MILKDYRITEKEQQMQSHQVTQMDALHRLECDPGENGGERPRFRMVFSTSTVESDDQCLRAKEPTAEDGNGPLGVF